HPMTAARFLLDDLRHAQHRSRLEPLRRADDDDAPAKERRGQANDAAAAVRRDGRDDQYGLGKGVAHHARHRYRIGQRHVREVDRVGASRHHLVDQGGVARPQPHLVPEAPEMHRERRAPAAGAEDGDPAHYTRTPRRCSVPVRSRRTFERWRKTISAAAEAAATTIGGGLPSAYASGGSAIDAATEPSEMYLVSQTTATNTASAGGRANGVSTANTPQAVATPLPPRNLSHSG